MRACKMSVCLLTVLLCMGLWSAPYGPSPQKSRSMGESCKWPLPAISLAWTCTRRPPSWWSTQ